MLFLLLFYHLQTALQLLEKSVHEKQDSLVTLRKQLEEMKAANLKIKSQLKVQARWREGDKSRGDERT